LISAIVLDLDGTFLNSNKEVSNRNMNAVLNHISKGSKVIIATARPPRSVKRFVPEELLRYCSFVYYNGALVIDRDNHIVEHTVIQQNEVSEIVDLFSRTYGDCKISIELNDIWYSNQEINDASIFNLNVLPKILHIKELKKLQATKMLISNSGNSIEIKELLRNRFNIVITDEGRLIQVMNKNVSKFTGISRLCDRYGIPLTEVIVFGDDYNDIEMFETINYSVAMGNGVEALKRLASELTDTNDNDGVAKVLERIAECNSKVTSS
jgi:Cof subfamily protein (haloacid dehalogenase superfamily)